MLNATAFFCLSEKYEDLKGNIMWWQLVITVLVKSFIPHGQPRKRVLMGVFIITTEKMKV